MASNTPRRKFSVKKKHPMVVDMGCGCRRTKLISSFFSTTTTPPKPKPKPQTPSKHHHPLSSYYPFSPSTNLSTTTTFSSSTSPPDYYSSASSTSFTTKHYKNKNKNKTKKYQQQPQQQQQQQQEYGNFSSVKESVAVVKESDDPYHDFKDSMLQMILEKEIYAWEDLRQLLHSFLTLNSSYHHDSILRAFTEIWNEVFSSSAAAPKKQPHRHRGYGYGYDFNV